VKADALVAALFAGATVPVRARVSGFVIDVAIARVPGARVSIPAAGPSTMTDANGAFVLARVP
jgi:hypothetical protein